MPAHWSAFHSLVLDLGEVCALLGSTGAGLEAPVAPEFASASRAKDDAAAAVHRVLDAGLAGPDEIEATLAEARAAVARARQCVARLRVTIEANQELRVRAERLVRASASPQPPVHTE